MIAPPGLPFTASVGSASLRPAPGTLGPESVRIEVGFANEERKARIVAWLGAGLRPGRPGRLEREYPLLFDGDGPATSVTLLDGCEPAAFCVLWPSRFELSGGVLRAGLISLVYTDSRHRRRGFARQVVQQAMEEARKQGLGLGLLWSDLEDFYSAQGFTRSGRESLLAVDASVLERARAATSKWPGSSDPASAPVRVEAARRTDWPQIEALRQQRPCFVSLANASDRLARIPDLDVRVARGAHGVTGFAMRGRGDDFEGVVHEWGGDPRAVLECCQSWLAADAAPDAPPDAPPDSPEAGLLLLSPRTMSPLTGELRRAGARVVANPLAWFRIASLESLCSDLATLVPGFGGIALSPCPGLDESEPRFRLEHRANGQSLEVVASELFGWLFGDVSEAAARRARARIDSIVPDGVRNALPLPFFVWGLESI